MNNEKFLKELNKDLSMSKKEMKRKTDDIVRELNDYKKLLGDELDNADASKRSNYKNASSTDGVDNYNEEGAEIFRELIKRNEEEGGMLDFENMDEEGYEILENVAASDPAFALAFLERRKDSVPEEKYNMLKTSLLKKMDIR